MSVKSKVKRCNAEIKHLKEQLETSELLNHKLQQQFQTLIDNKTLASIAIPPCKLPICSVTANFTIFSSSTSL